MSQSLMNTDSKIGSPMAINSVPMSNPDFNKISFACFILMAVGLSLDMMKKSLITTSNEEDSMKKSWLITVQTTTITVISLFILSVSSLVFGDYLASLPMLLLTVVLMGKLGMYYFFKKQMTKYPLPDMYDNFNYASNGLFALIMITLYNYSKTAFMKTSENMNKTSGLRILLILFSLIYSVVNFGIIFTILNNFLTEG